MKSILENLSVQKFISREIVQQKILWFLKCGKASFTFANYFRNYFISSNFRSMKTSTSATSLGETSTSSRQAESVFGFCLGLPSCSPSFSYAVDVSLIWRIFFLTKSLKLILPSFLKAMVINDLDSTKSFKRDRRLKMWKPLGVHNPNPRPPSPNLRIRQVCSISSKIPEFMWNQF